ncbi:hypothetical protein Tco_0449570 [Tanacetum coccineum]
MIDDEDDDDDEGPSAGSNQGKSAKRRRHDSGASGSAQPPTKDDEQSLKKPRESDASASKQHPALTSTGWQITDTRDVVVDSSMHRSDPELEHSEQSSDDIPMQDEGHVSDLEDTEWTTPPNDFPEPENNWANTYTTTYQVPTENKLQRKTERDYTSSAAMHHSLELKEMNFYINKHKWSPQIREAADPRCKSRCELVSRNRVGDLQLGIESYQTKINLERPNWDAADYYFKEDYTIVPKPRAVVYKDRNDQRKLMRLNELHKFSDGTLTRAMETRNWSEDDKRRSKDFITAIEKRLQIMRGSFESRKAFVWRRIRDIEYRPDQQTT